MSLVRFLWTIFCDDLYLLFKYMEKIYFQLSFFRFQMTHQIWAEGGVHFLRVSHNHFAIFQTQIFLLFQITAGVFFEVFHERIEPVFSFSKIKVFVRSRPNSLCGTAIFAQCKTLISKKMIITPFSPVKSCQSFYLTSNTWKRLDIVFENLIFREKFFRVI